MPFIRMMFCLFATHIIKLGNERGFHKMSRKRHAVVSEATQSRGMGKCSEQIMKKQMWRNQNIWQEFYEKLNSEKRSRSEYFAKPTR